jgi:porin
VLAAVAALATTFPLEVNWVHAAPGTFCPGEPTTSCMAWCTSDVAGEASAASIGNLLNRGEGLSLDPVYYGEVFTNAKGGVSTRKATLYQALLDLPLTLDFEKLDWPVPGRFYMLAQNTHGRGLTADFIGDFQVVSNIDSFDNITQVSEYWWEIGLLDQRVAVRLGKHDANTEFLNLHLALDFVHSSFGLSPTAGLPSYPDPAMAGLVLAQVTRSLNLKVGVWDALAIGKDWGISGNQTTITLGELEYQSALRGGCLPGVLELGAVYFSGGDIAGQSFPWRRGFYVQFEQLILREPPCQDVDAQGLGAFVRYSSRFSNRELPIPSVWEGFLAGIVYRGLIPGRDQDVAGSGVAWAKLDEAGTRQETALEVFYKAALRPWLRVQPDLQYIASPSGIHRDALAVGVRLESAF